MQGKMGPVGTAGVGRRPRAADSGSGRAAARTVIEMHTTRVIEEKVGGSKRDGRTELQMLLEFMRLGDTLVVTRIDRLARSVMDLRHRARTEAEGVMLRAAAAEQPIDTGTAAGKAFLDMRGVLADEFETNLRAHQLEGSAIGAMRSRSVASPRGITSPRDCRSRGRPIPAAARRGDGAARATRSRSGPGLVDVAIVVADFVAPLGLPRPILVSPQRRWRITRRGEHPLHPIDKATHRTLLSFIG